MFTEKDLHQIEQHGLTREAVERQIENFRRGFPFLKVVRAASPGAPGAKEARLSFRVLGRDAALDTALVHVRLQTGRKHQIRVQLAHSGHPLVADMRYGRGVRGQPVALWGAVLRLTHPTRKEPMTFLSAPRGDAFCPMPPQSAALSTTNGREPTCEPIFL